MRAVVQRVSEASVEVDGRVIGRIGAGFVVLLGIAKDDGHADVAYVVSKVPDLRVFGDDEGKLNRSLVDVKGAVLLVSQFTLYGDCRKGRRPSFDEAAPASIAQALYEDVGQGLRRRGIAVQTGEFQSLMQVRLVNDGPVTLLLDSRRGF
jgi:D-tyrosyl-tRNA(Tyr) deacylase